MDKRNGQSKKSRERRDVTVSFIWPLLSKVGAIYPTMRGKTRGKDRDSSLDVIIGPRD